MRKNIKLNNCYCNVGWQSHLQDNYDNFEDFLYYNEIYELSKKLGYSSAKRAWHANPLVQGSTDPRDFQKCKPGNTCEK